MGAPMKTMLNGVELATLATIPETLVAEPDKAKVAFHTRTFWLGAMRTRSEVVSMTMGGEALERRHVVEADEPPELLGTDSAANPQELILSAIGSCLSAIFVIHASAMGIELRSLEVELSGGFDMRGPLQLADLPCGFSEVSCRVRLASDAPREQLEALHAKALATSPNYYHLTTAIPAKAELVIAN